MVSVRKQEKKLLRHFKTITAMKQAGLEELQTIGISGESSQKYS